MIVRMVVRATRFLSTRQQRRQMEGRRRQHPEDYAKRAQVIEEESQDKERKSDKPDA